MSSSLRTRRMARNHKRMRQQPKLNLVALMDIFTILVLFLMVNNGEVEVLQSDNKITLPDSVSELRPDLALTIKITPQDIIVQGRSIRRVDDAMAQQGTALEELGQELLQQASREPELTEHEQTAGRAVIIMGDQNTPYQLLKRVMTTCAQSGYRDISLAVNSKPPAPIDPATLAMGRG
jgi:biopolymer transport protein ExbD